MSKKKRRNNAVKFGAIHGLTSATVRAIFDGIVRPLIGM